MFDVDLHAKNQFHPFFHHFFCFFFFVCWDIAKILQTFHFGYFRYTWLWPVKRYYQLVQNHVNPSRLSWDITKILQTCYFGYFRCAWPHPPKLITVTCRELWCLSANCKSTWSINFFLEILHFKESCNLIDQKHVQ